MMRAFTHWLKTKFTSEPNYDRGLTAISEAAPAPRARLVLWSVLLLLVILLAWALIGKLDVIATAEGKLIPQNYLKIIQPTEGGVLQELLVREGEHVEAGQVLIRMDARLSETDTQSIAAELALRRLQLRRIDAELHDKNFDRQQGDPPELFAKVHEQFIAYRNAYENNLEQEKAGLQKSRQELASATQVKEKLRKSMDYYDKQTDSFQKLSKDGYVSPLFVQDKERERGEKEHDYKAHQSTLDSLESAIRQNEAKLAQITSTYYQQLQTERIQALTQHERLTHERDKQNLKNISLELKAPQAGIVKDIATHTIGTVVNPGTILLTLVPLDEPLMAEVQIKNQDAGFIYATQAARVKIASYPFQKYGMLDGEVTHFSADASETTGGRAEEINTEGRLAVTANYKAHIKLKAQELTAQGDIFKLLPGMQVVAEIRLGERTVMEYLLSPVQKTVREAARER